MKVLITGHKGFIGRHVFADWRRELGYAHVRGIDYPNCVSSFKGGDFDLSSAISFSLMPIVNTGKCSSDQIE